MRKLSQTARALPLEQTLRKIECEENHLYFARYFFKKRQSINFLINWHHHWIADVLEDVIQGKLKNVIFNVSPGASKTELVVINLIARGLALNPRSRFLYLSYSDDLTLTFSKAARDLVQSDEFQELWPFDIAEDSKAKKRWNIVVDCKEAGGVYASALGGQITGFRAGHMKEGWQGAIIIDDPLKPEDAYSETKLRAANRRLVSTVKSRRANPDTPCIVIMQRIAEKDPTAFILQGALGGEWKHVVIPAIIDDDYVTKQVPERYHELIDRSERDEKGRFSYWPYKEPIAELVKMEAGQGMDGEGAKINRHVFSSQWMQTPRAIGGNILRGEWFKRVTLVPKIRYRKMFADTAQKTKERNDYSVFGCYGLGDDGKLYLLDLIRGKWEAPELKRKAIAFWAKHNTTSPPADWYTTPVGVEGWAGQLRKLVVEDKSSGTGLIQEIKADPKTLIRIEGKERGRDKLTRALDTQPSLEAGFVCVPENAPFTSDFIEEAEAFTADDTHAFDDQMDTLFDAVEDMLSSKNSLEQWKNII